MANDELQHVALPKLYGAPAYARPPAVPVLPVERPFDPDALPLESVQTDEERELALSLAAGPHSNGGAAQPAAGARAGSALLRARPFRLRAITTRLRGDRDDSARA